MNICVWRNGLAGKGPWNAQRIYSLFPRLAERKSNGGAQLSGGEQQMLAIARALLFDPKLLVMDEPTEGLAPVIVEQVAEMLKTLTGDSEIAVLLIEQNLGVAIDVADTVGVMVNGRIARTMPAAELAANRELQQQLLGVRTIDEDTLDGGEPTPASPPQAAATMRCASTPSAAPMTKQRATRCARRERAVPCVASPAGTPPILVCRWPTGLWKAHATR